MAESVPLIRIGGSGSLGITLPKDELDKRGIEAGDRVVILPGDEPDSVKLYFPPDE